MKLLLDRDASTEAGTPGRLFVDGIFECYTLELPERPKKIAGNTAIPAGTYRLACTWSSRFHRYMPELENVPDFTAVRIHPGNTERDTEGCILVGRKRLNREVIEESQWAYEFLAYKLFMAWAIGQELQIEIEPATRPAREA